MIICTATLDKTAHQNEKFQMNPLTKTYLEFTTFAIRIRGTRKKCVYTSVFFYIV